MPQSMKHRRRSTIAAVLMTLFGPGAFAALPAAGTAAPDFVLKSHTGQNIRLKELRGEVVLVNFWATWCGPCRQELPQLDRLQARHRQVGLRLLAVNVDDDPRKAEAMHRQLGLKLTVLFDKDKRVAERYDVDSMPATLLIDRDGRVRYVHRGYRTGYETTYEQQVRELLRE
jgi:peroxiredoxin